MPSTLVALSITSASISSARSSSRRRPRRAPGSDAACMRLPRVRLLDVTAGKPAAGDVLLQLADLLGDEVTDGGIRLPHIRLLEQYRRLEEAFQLAVHVRLGGAL